MSSSNHQSNTQETLSKNSKLHTFVRRFQCFENCADESIDLLASHAEYVSYQPRDTIIAMGQFDGSFLYGVHSGEAKLTKAPQGSLTLDVQEVGEGDIVGLTFALAGQEGGLQSISLVAETEVEIIEFDWLALKTVCLANVDILNEMLKFNAGKLLRLEAPEENSIDPSRRIYRYLVDLAENKNGIFAISDMPRHAIVGQAAGVSALDAATAIGELIKNEVVRREHPSLIIQDMDTLRAMAF